MALVTDSALLAGLQDTWSARGGASSHDGRSGGQPEAGNPRKQNDKPSGHPVLFRAPCLLQCLCVTHKLNAHFPPLPLFFSCSDFSHVYLLVSVRIQLVLLSLKETGRHTWGHARAGQTPTKRPSWNSGAVLNWNVAGHSKALCLTRLLLLSFFVPNCSIIITHFFLP